MLRARLGWNLIGKDAVVAAPESRLDDHQSHPATRRTPQRHLEWEKVRGVDNTTTGATRGLRGMGMEPGAGLIGSRCCDVSASDVAA